MRTPTLTVIAVLAAAAAAAQGAPEAASGDAATSRRDTTPIRVAPAATPDPEALEASCNAGKALNCERLARVHMGRGPAIAANREQAMLFYEKACDGGRATSCTHLARLYRMAHRGRARGRNFTWGSSDPLPANSDPETIAQDDARADALFRKACDGGDGRACLDLAHSLRRGMNRTGDATVFAELYEKACEARAGMACLIVGDMYRGGKGVERDPARGLALLERGCEQGDPTACSAASKMYELGENGEKDPQRAQELLAKAGQPGQTRGQVQGFVGPMTPQAE